MLKKLFLKPIKCMKIINGKPLRFRGDPYHPYHFTCSNCEIDLDHKARDVGGKLYCLPCHDKMGIPICATCRRPIGKNWEILISNDLEPKKFSKNCAEDPILISTFKREDV